MPIGLALLLSLILAPLPLTAHPCACCVDAFMDAPCVVCAAACGAVATAPCCGVRATDESKQAPSPSWDHSSYAALTHARHADVNEPFAAVQMPPTGLHGPPLFIVHRALLL